MANHKRKYPRTKQHTKNRNWSSTPASWNIEYHSRPRRRQNKAMETKIRKGGDPDGINWPTDKKPHKYYW